MGPTGFGGPHQQGHAPGELLAGGTPDKVDVNKLPEIVTLARDVAPVLRSLVPADITVFLEVVDGLGQHASNLVLQYIIIMAKYPTAMRILGKHFRVLPAKITPRSLRAACHAGILEAAALVQGEIFRQEMLIFDDQRMGTVMGLPRVMEQFGFLQRSTSALPASGRFVSLGRAKPPLKYKLTYDQQVLEKCLREVHDLQLELPDRLSNRILVQYANALSALAKAWPILRRRKKASAKDSRTKRNAKQIAKAKR